MKNRIGFGFKNPNPFISGLHKRCSFSSFFESDSSPEPRGSNPDPDPNPVCNTAMKSES